MLSARSPLVWCLGATALAACLAAVTLDMVPGGGSEANGADGGVDCDDKRLWDSHLRRVALYSMYPKGTLRHKDGSPNDHRYRYRWRVVTRNDPMGQRRVELEDHPANTYVDKAGVEWILLPSWRNREHQPEGQEDDEPNKKFIALDATGGSFEAIVEPDPASPTGAPAYGSGANGAMRWIKEGPLMGTYNYYDALDSPFRHTLYDYLPHKFGRKDYHPTISELDPERTPEWRTYRDRAEALIALFAEPSESKPRLETRDSGLVLVSGEDDATGEAERPVDDDLAGLAHLLARCRGIDKTKPDEAPPGATESRPTEKPPPAPPEQPTGESPPAGDGDVSDGHCVVRRQVGRLHSDYEVFRLQEGTRLVRCSFARTRFLEYFARRLSEGRGETRFMRFPDGWTCGSGSRSIEASCGDGKGNIIAVRSVDE